MPARLGVSCLTTVGWPTCPAGSTNRPPRGPRAHDDPVVPRRSPSDLEPPSAHRTRTAGPGGAASGPTRTSSASTAPSSPPSACCWSCSGLATGWLPGPGGIPLILGGLAVWASEFRWAHRLMLRLKHALHVYQGWTRRRKVVSWLVFLAACGLLGWAYLAVVGPPAWIPVQVDRVLDLLPGVDSPPDRAAMMAACAPPSTPSSTHRSWPSPTAAAPRTPRTSAARTPATPSPRPSRSATATSRPTSTPPPTAGCSRSTTRCSTASRTAPEPSRAVPAAELAGVRIGGRDPIPTFAELLEAFPDRPLQRRRQVRRRPSTCWPTPSATTTRTTGCA